MSLAVSGYTIYRLVPSREQARDEVGQSRARQNISTESICASLLRKSTASWGEKITEFKELCSIWHHEKTAKHSNI